ncbi:MAG TPA: c-type cytochrome [Sphingobacteriaceae bacterium]
MKKPLIIFFLCAAVAACTSEKKTDNNQDSAAESHMYAEDRQSEYDSAQQKTGTEPSAGEAGAPAGNGEQLIAQSDCLTCHKVDEKLIGPSYVEVAQKYENNDKNIDYLADKIIKGGSGVWGQVPMTPHPTLSSDDAKAMARYVLSLRK